MQSNQLSACLCALISLTVIHEAAADDKNIIGTMDSVTVYATRSAASTFEVPAMVSRVDAEGPGTANAGTISDLLQFTPGVEVENGSRRNGQTISIRGFDNDSIITLIDGRRQNFEAAHDGRFYIDPALLKSVEIVRGASSSIYGGGGIGGVVAFDTKDASDMLEPGQKFGALTSYSYRTANGESAPLLAAYGRTGGVDLLGSIGYRRSGDIRLGDMSGKSGTSTLLTKDRVTSGLVIRILICGYS